MTKKAYFWSGFSLGSALTALVFAASQKRDRSAYPVQHDISSSSLKLRRDQSESAGDPAALTPSLGEGRAADFERPGGAPGPGHQPESLEVPGQPGASVDYSDPSQSVKPASRTVLLKP